MGYSRNAKKKKRINVYFDTETYNSYTHLPKDPNVLKKLAKIDQLPIVIPYLVGACTDEPDSYTEFIGRDASHQFLRWLFDIGEGCEVTLWAFNIDFDFQAIKAFIRQVNPSAYVEYLMTSDKKFICGKIQDKTTKPYTNIYIRDLWVWNKAGGSLKKNYEFIHKLAQTEQKWADLIKLYKIPKLEKLILEDPFKKDLHYNQILNKYFYYDIDDNLKELNLQAELDYLKMDVIGLPILREFQKDFRQTCIDGLGLTDLVDYSRIATAYSVPGFGKYLSEVYLQTTFDHLYRFPTTLEDYIEQDLSYIGGFTANNKDIFKLEDCRHPDGTPKIECYDVNSMYPTIMNEALPWGDILNVPPEEGDYCTWYTIWFDEPLANGNLYQYKPEYNQLNNDFFGDWFFLRNAEDQRANGIGIKRYYVEKSLFEMFMKVCISNVKVDWEDVKYQRLSTSLNDFVKIIYDKKANAPTKWERDSFKLLLNSLYGKMGERWHDDYWRWDSDTNEFVPEQNDMTYRETILAGLYITSRSRVMLWEGITTEIENGNVILSVDTDSMKLIANNPVKINVNPTILGAWKFEGYATHFYHNGKLKRYYLHNADDPSALKIATSGFSKEDLSKLPFEDLRILYDPNTNTLFRKSKLTSKRNRQQQIIIFNTDIEFNDIVPISHEYKDGRIVPYASES